MFIVKLWLSVLVLALIQGCDGGLEIDLQTNLAENSVIGGYKVSIDPSKLCSDITVKDPSGKDVRGTRNCSKAVKICERSGEVSCFIADGSLYGVGKASLKPENIKAGVTIAGIAGTLVSDEVFCSREGQSACVTTARFKPATKAGLADKLISSATVGGVTGTFTPDLPDAANVVSSARSGSARGTFAVCTAPNQTGCALSANHKATQSFRADQINDGVTIGGVTGTFKSSRPNCSASNDINCVATAGAPALDKSKLLSRNLLDGYTLLGQAGAVNRRPGQCNADNQQNCVAEGAMRTVARRQITASNLRQGVRLAGVTGTYPSASAPLPGADAGVADLTRSDFVSRITNAAPFEFWDAAGVRHQVVGSSDLSRPNILTGATVFGLAGQLVKKPDSCTVDNQADCVAVAAFPAIDKRTVSAAQLRKGVIIAGVTGTYPSATNPLPGSTGKKLLAVPADLASASATEFWDAAGGYHSVSGSADLTSAQIREDITIFGVRGNAQPKPADCGSHDQQGCVATGAFPSYQRSTLTAGVVKNGHRINTLVGSYPSASARLPDNTGNGSNDLTAASFGTKLQSTDTFEFWDAHGVHHTASGSTTFSQNNILEPLNVFGLVGTLKKQPPSCMGRGISTINCLTNAANPSYDPAVIKPEFIKAGEAIGRVTGGYPSASHPLPLASGTVTDLTQSNFNARMASAQTFEYWDSNGVRYTSAGDSDLIASNIRLNTPMFGITGAAEGAPKNCDSENEVGCVTTASFKSYDQRALDMSTIKNGHRVFGQQGTFPSANDRLPNNTGMIDLTAGNVNTAMRQDDDFEFFDRFGNRYSAKGSLALQANNLRKDVSLFGLTGTLVPKPSTCRASNDPNCIADANFPAFEKAKLRPEVLKRGVRIGGVLGAYPSSTYPLPQSTGMTDLTGPTFNSAVASAATVEFFDRLGQRRTLTGDADLVAGNLNATKKVFGVQGTFQGMSPDVKWDMMYGTNIGGVVHGGIKTNCRNLSDNDIYRLAGFPQDATIGDESSSRFPPHNPWGNNNVVCGEDVFTDVSRDGSGNLTNCRDGVTCIYKDNIAQLLWRQTAGNTTVASAKNYCKSIGVKPGEEKWRLPTQKEALAAHVHGFQRLGRKPGHANKFVSTAGQLTSTRAHTNATHYVLVWMGDGGTSTSDYAGHSHCVQTAPR